MRSLPVVTPAVRDRPAAEVQIRPVRDADWAQVWPILADVAQAQQTYAIDPALSQAAGRAMWWETPPGLAVVAVDGDRVLGSAKMGPNRSGPGRHIATASFLVADAARGRGIGRALGEWVIAWSAREGFRGIQFNAVVETNDQAVRLWHRLGFRTVGTVPEAFAHPDHGLVGLHVMYRPLP